jgi:CheY-like chemotaxis protein
MPDRARRNDKELIMSLISVFSGTYCGKEPIIEEVLSRTGFREIPDDAVLEKASSMSGLNVGKIRSAFESRTSVFNKFTHEKERSTAWIRLAVAEMLSEDEWLLNGFSGHLIPKDITHLLRICIIADIDTRVTMAETDDGLGKKAALNRIHSSDEDRVHWVYSLFKTKDPWEPSLYDIVIPTDKSPLEESVDLIVENLRNEVILPTDSSRRAVADFLLASRVGVELAEEGHTVESTARDGAVTVTIDKNVLMLNRLEAELKSIASRIEGVRSVETRIGKGFHRADIYRKYDFEVPKLLLVDDEREFVQTLSERLLMRNMGSAVAYDGETALGMIQSEDPEVMILDLKMPGIDGIEVLRKVKQTRPEIAVIILTGHGSEEDYKTCMELGAFAYLHKPIDIEVLTETLKKANEFVRKQAEERDR